MGASRTPSRGWVLVLAVAAGTGQGLAEPLANPAPIAADTRASGASEKTAGDDRALPEMNLPEPTGTVTLEDALALALIRSPELDMFSWDMRVDEARELQAGKRPNPELDVRVYRLGIPRQNAELDEARSRVILSQTVELGGKRRRRIDFAETERQLSGLDYEVKRAELTATVTRRFIAVLGAQRRVESLTDYLEFFEHMQETVRGLVETGAMRSLENHRVNRWLGLAGIDQQRAENELATARHRLAATWGSVAPQFTRALGDLEPLEPIPPLEVVLDLAKSSPAVTRWDGELARGEAALKLAESSRIPDFDVGAGVRWQDDFDERDYLVDLEISLPIFDRKQGDILEARHSIDRARAGREASEASNGERIAGLYYSLVESRERGIRLSEEIIPATRAMLEALEVGLAQGVTGLADLFDARRDLVRAEVQHTGSLVEYHDARAALEGLLGQSLEAGD